ncbi:uncharacterized protein LOC141641022 [Silene latifolia]|uniref:uncharacterized protein LOC141641022 n=1 Tax=Silene latifolia TaxID=37657 RepID=UPI003D789372
MEFGRVRACLKDYEGFEVDSTGRSGGLPFMWKKEVGCQLRSASIHHIDMDVSWNNKMWRVTGFYGWPVVSDRHLSWQLLRILKDEYDGPWVCVGDFNEILYATEMKGGTQAQWQMNNFREAVNDCGLRDVVFEGYEFTFDNGQANEANRQCRLDRAMGNEGWFELFPYARVEHLVREWSDHSPIKLWLERRSDGRQGKKLFSVRAAVDW